MHLLFCAAAVCAMCNSWSRDHTAASKLYTHSRYMAPEVLELEVGPEADVWSAGVMAFQLLSGYLPFDDRSNPKGPSVARIWCV